MTAYQRQQQWLNYCILNNLAWIEGQVAAILLLLAGLYAQLFIREIDILTTLFVPTHIYLIYMAGQKVAFHYDALMHYARNYTHFLESYIKHQTT